uniref:Polysaccharide chain length determinant N-terminal domain-containing protein n=1 Tax=Bosea sp. NBC_00436 TaxID=2969620 RepID=A0A9E8CSE6_9HYPH
MMDTRSRPQVAPSTEGLEARIKVRPRPSFGLGSLRSRKWLLALGTIGCLAIAAAYVSLRPATYTASSQLLIYIRQVLTGPDQAILPGRADLPMVQNQIELLRSGNVLATVVETLHLVDDPEFKDTHAALPGDAKAPQGQTSPEAASNGAAYRAALAALGRKLSVRQVGTSHIVAVSLKASDPAKAARIVNAIVRTYLQERARASDAASSHAPTLREIYQNLGPSAQILSEAEPPVGTDGPSAILILAIAALVGLGASVAVALLLDMFSDGIRSRDQMEFALGLECLGVAPRFPGIGAWPEDAAARHLLTSQQEALRRATAVMDDVSPEGFHAIGVTSILPGEGTTSLAIALARTAAAAGKRVLLVDAVPDDPSLSRWVAKLAQDPPLPGEHPRARALDGLAELQPGLDVLPLDKRLGAGDRLMPRGLLDDILRAAESAYNLVILDMPALAAGPQARAAASALDGLLLVVKWGETQSELVRQAFQSAGEARGKFIGSILNMADERVMQRYGYELHARSKAATTA